ncbi:IS1096 element passenger TnpR family protein [Sulfurisphaera tokodaii]|uniref:Plasmid pRiA4b Orf3-like domain-containing protein n=2 Tax=Sulfurisphaera tokodaii TaxID=111955 RepID=Q96ZQ4_SULTO|nr:hypothetical protein [Sulfurisphaera tokodaii]BAB66870.1 hypothetical protein STK_17800 [Sulfurisphaera tokodaii str. 7]HII73815.1 plasmid pRiA4b ORF-3 family protein [Sulfurisphaera tokodaii]
MVSKGKCLWCEKGITTSTALRHFNSCDKVKDILNGKIDGFLIKVKDKFSSDYWLYIAVPSSFTLEDLDNFLRDIWVECCGHLSEFMINGVHYGSSNTMEVSEEEPDILEFVPASKKKLSDVLDKGLKFNYTYDFGSSTELILTVIDNVKLKDKKIYVLGRNDQPQFNCAKCGKQAEYICYECLGDTGNLDESTYCKDCLKTHEHADENSGFIPNSPRVGVCGYVGDEEMEKIKVWPIKSGKSLRLS